MPSNRRPGGLAAALEEERLELSADIHNSSTHRNTSTAHALPRRSVLDTATGPSPGFVAPRRHSSIAGIGVDVTPPAGLSYQDSPQTSPKTAPIIMDNETTETPSSSTSTTPSTTPITTPKTTYTSLKTAPPPLKRPDPPADKDKNGDKKGNSHEARRPSIRWDSGVDMPPSANGSRRFGPPQEKAPRGLSGKNAMAAVMSGFDLNFGLPSFSRGRDSSRGPSKRGTSLDSHLPPARRAQSGSPARRLPNSSLRSPVSGAPKSSTDKTKESKAERVVEEKLARPPAPHRGYSETDARSSASGDGRLYDSDHNASETSEEEVDLSSSDEEASSENNSDDIKRGRKKAADRNPSTGGETAEEVSKPASDETHGVEAKSEDSELIHSSKTGPMPRTPEVQPHTSFESPSVLNTPFGSDDEAELSDIKRAQKLSIQMSNVDNSVRNRSIRTIIRGDYTSMQEDPEGGLRRQRKYLVTTDLSEESVYALEWTIGTILRDGDTMFAVFAMHEETGTQIGEGAKETQDVAAVVGSQTAETAQKSQTESNPNLSRALLNRLGSGTDSRPSSVDSRGMSKVEAERSHAAHIISQTCVRLLRKTLLQVRVAVEVIHCKSPKHMITEAIDGLEPTLVIVGARGRSALKGVLLGSFSNYLVTHSSVPVMVARKKLRTKAKNKTNVRLSNNLTTPKKLSSARVD
ncbi:hypothetical protein BJX76DRAFT_11818 [Aspergillus varians]